MQRKLMDDIGSIEHEIIADIEGEIAEETLHRLQRLLDGTRESRTPLPQAKVSVNSSNPERSRLRFAVKGAHPGLVAYLCEQTQLPLLALRRIRLGRIALADLPVGQWRYLNGHERF